MKIVLIAATALSALSSLSAAAPPSPVGTWEVALSGADRGTAYVTFEDDHDLTGYGLTRGSMGIFTLSGTWSVDAAGRLSGSYTETINGGPVTGTLTGKVAAKRIGGTITATNGKFAFKGRRESATADLSGPWNGIVILGKQRLPETYQLSPGALPHVYQLTGTGLSPLSGGYSILGTVLAGAGGRVELVAFSFDPWGASGFATLGGKVNPARRQGVLAGTRSTGQPIRISLRR